ncbi:hypothetical protein NQZ68_035313, partial [Dissostichus eleginoides]
ERLLVKGGTVTERQLEQCVNKEPVTDVFCTVMVPKEGKTLDEIPGIPSITEEFLLDHQECPACY